VAMREVATGVTVKVGARVEANPVVEADTHREKVPGGEVPMLVLLRVKGLVVPMGVSEAATDPVRVGAREETTGEALLELISVREAKLVEGMGVRDRVRVTDTVRHSETDPVLEAALVEGMGERDRVRLTDVVRLIVGDPVLEAGFVEGIGDFDVVLETDRVRVTEVVRVTDRVRVTDTVAERDANPPACCSQQRRSRQRRRRNELKGPMVRQIQGIIYTQKA
jgi:hypothetical protein